MIQYAICEITGRQYKVLPNVPFQIDYQEGEDIEANVLMLVSDGKLQIGKPYLKEKITLKIIENTKGRKIRVGKFHAKANYRRVVGFRPKLTRVIFDVKRS